MIEVNNITYKHIVSIEQLTIDRDITCIVGASGCGKTTFLRMLNRLQECDCGDIHFKRESIYQQDPVHLRRRVVMLGQTPIIYEGTIEENLQIGLRFAQKKPASKATLRDCLQKVQLPKQLDESCHTLSGGEKQRLCLARVMLMDADLYLMDEPSAALDSETECFVIQQLVHFIQSEKKQLIMVTHSNDIANMYPRAIMYMKEGTLRGYAHE